MVLITTLKVGDLQVALLVDSCFDAEDLTCICASGCGRGITARILLPVTEHCMRKFKNTVWRGVRGGLAMETVAETSYLLFGARKAVTPTFHNKDTQ